MKILKVITNILGIITIILLYLFGIFVCWVGAAQVATLYLPESLWIPTACVGMLFGMGWPFAFFKLSDLEK